MTDPRYRSAQWQKLRAEVIERDGRFCSVSGCTSDMTRRGQTQVDHIHAVKDGGDFWDPVNLHVLCKTHHQAKSLVQAADRLNLKAKTNPEPASPNG